MVASGYDFTVLIAIVFAGYFGGRAHKPRTIGLAVISFIIGLLVFASPQLTFIFGSYHAGSSNASLVCMDPSNFTVNCQSSNGGALFMFILGDIFMGIAGAITYTVGIAYIDEIVFPKYVSLHIGFVSAMLVLGPSVGFGLGSAFLTLYVNPWEETNLTEDDPAWVGAWWIPFVLTAVVAVFLAIPFLMFPKWLPDSTFVREERAKEMAKIYVYPSKYANEDSLTIAVKMFPIHIKRLLTNPPFVLVTLALSAFYIFGQGLLSFSAKYIEVQFNLRASTAGLVTGAVAIPGAGRICTNTAC